MRAAGGWNARLVAAGLAVWLVTACGGGSPRTPYAGDAGDAGGAADLPAAADQRESPDPAEVPEDELAFSGLVYDERTLAPVAGALVSTNPPVGQLRTNGQGMYVFAEAEFPELRAGERYTVRAEAHGYLTNTTAVLLSEGHLRHVDIPLTPAAAVFRLAVSPEWVDLTDADFLGGRQTTGAQVRIQAVGADAAEIPYTVNVPPAAAAWLSVAPLSGTVGEAPVFVSLTVDRAALPGPGYRVGRGEVGIVAAGGVTPVLVTVRLGDPPCEPCAEGEYCDGAQCVPAVCSPSCAGRVCGVDGCGRSCGACPGGFVCTAAGLCAAPVACAADDDCGPAERCGRDRQCFAATCESDADCPADLFCGMDGWCYWLDEFGCDVDSDCPPGGVCSPDGACVPEG